MSSKNLNESVDPKNQLSIYGYKDYLDFFIKLYQKNKLPNVILLNGPKGIGKATSNLQAVAGGKTSKVIADIQISLDKSREELATEQATLA